MPYIIDGDCIVHSDTPQAVIYDCLSENFTPQAAQALVDLMNEGYDDLSWEEIEPLVEQQLSA